MSTKKTVSLMLLDNLDHLGIVGDVVDVKVGYARNYLLPMGLATEPTEEARAAVEERRAQVERELSELRAKREKLIADLEGFELTVQRAANDQGVLFGSVTQHDIVVAMAEEGYELTEREVRIGEPFKHLDSYTVPIQVDDDLKTEIKLWVVSDKPAEELMEEALAEGEEGEPAETTEQTTDEAEPASTGGPE